MPACNPELALLVLLGSEGLALLAQLHNVQI